MRPVCVLFWFFVACSSGGGKTVDPGSSDIPATDPGIPSDPGPESAPDVPADPGFPDLFDAVEAVSDESIAVDVAADDPEVVEPFPPRKLPFEFTRPDVGVPLTAQEVTAFTKRVTGLWQKIGWFRWVLRTSQGVDASTGKDDFLAWYNDSVAVKKGDEVTFSARGGEHNMWIPGSKILSQAINGYLLTGDWVMGKLAEQYCKGLTAVVKGFVYDENDPAPWLMARSIFPMDHAFTLDAERWKDDGRKKAVEYHDMYHIEDGWNAHTFAWPHNPTWGSIWVTNMRSKDDVCAITRTTTFLPYVVADAKDDFVRQACQETLDTMKAFHKDIVDSGYNIRTKDADGKAHVVTDQDLGSYVWYVDVDERNEYPARLATDLIAYGERKVHQCEGCETGFGSMYDAFSTVTHYYNYPIIWNYHMAAVGAALVYQKPDLALPMLKGLAQRIDSYVHPSADEPGAKRPDWHRDLAVLLVQAGAVGLPLTSEEARIVHEHWTQTVAYLESWPRWDLWDASVPEGEYSGGSGFRPADTDDAVPVEAVAMFVEYCNSPFRNPSGAVFVDCDVVKDVASWGKE